MTRLNWASFQDDELRKAHFETYAVLGGIVFDQLEQGDLFTDNFKRESGAHLAYFYRAAIAASGSQSMADQRIYFDLRQRVPRMTIHGVQLVRSQAMVRLPFCDNDLVDFYLTVPPGLRFERYLIKRTFVKNYPGLAKVPYTETNLPMVPTIRELMIRANHYLRWRVRAAGLKWISAPQTRPYADYNTWMRTILREWVENTLLDNKSLERGYFNSEYIRQLIAEHMAGANHAKKLGMLLSLELWHRKYLD